MKHVILQLSVSKEFTLACQAKRTVEARAGVKVSSVATLLLLGFLDTPVVVLLQGQDPVDHGGGSGLQHLLSTELKLLVVSDQLGALLLFQEERGWNGDYEAF